jgi:hypothetical protein
MLCCALNLLMVEKNGPRRVVLVVKKQILVLDNTYDFETDYPPKQVGKLLMSMKIEEEVGSSRFEYRCSRHEMGMGHRKKID